MNPETFTAQSENQEVLEIESKIKNTKTLDELYAVLDSIGSLTGTQGNYSSQELKEIIEGISQKKFPLEGITRSYGLRDKVYELLGDDIVSSELEERKIFKSAMMSANSIDELIRVLYDAKSKYNIVDDEYFEAQKTTDTIYEILKKEKTIEDITPAYGIRECVQSLMSKQVLTEEIRDEQAPSIDVKNEEQKIEPSKSLEVNEKQELEKRLDQIVANIEVLQIKAHRVQVQLAETSKPPKKSFLTKLKGWFKKEQPIEQDNLQILREEEKELSDEIEKLSHEQVVLLEKLKSL